ncbi:MAG: oligosaccharide flippase family protein [Polyangia bacterium]|jgi:O-antigen/teichoic acid export membrane protein
MDNLATKAVRGAFTYLLRQVLVAAVTFLSNIVILRWLLPADFGFLATVGMIQGVVQIISDGGLSIYFIQRHDEIDPKILSQITTLQLSLYAAAHSLATLVLLICYFSHFHTVLIWLIWAALFSIPLNVFRANSFIILERSLAFGKIATIEILESLTYAIVSIVLAMTGMGAWSLILASFVKGFLGWRVAARYNKWRFEVCWPKFDDELKRGLRFGINYHVPALITAIRIAVNPILIGGLLGMSAVGIADRAIYIAGLPLFFLGAIQSRVLFPYFARIQTDIARVRSNFEKSYYVSAVIDKVFYIPLVLFAPQLLGILAPKWMACVPLVYIAMIGNITFGALSFSSFPVLNGLGRSDVNAKLSALAMVLSWISAWPFIAVFGLAGYAYVGLLLWVVGSIPGVVLLRRFVPGSSLWRPFFLPLFSFAVGCAIVWYLIVPLVDLNLFWVVSLSTVGVGLYVLVLGLLDSRNLLGILGMMRSALGARQQQA